MRWSKFPVVLLGLLGSTSSLAGSPNWEDTLEKVVPAVVSLQVSSTRAFDTESASSSQGTGFVVDAENGILLTNRHMVEPGPVVAQAIFQNHEEVDIHAIYRDPVHDFGFYRFDPEDVRFLDLVELPLVPDAAKIGVDIRVIGNDAGEKISILSGTLARLDRDAPRYGGNGYNDFNTFYYQAASSTSGGSSGSPVVDIQGRVLALNAGGSMGAASSFYLPLQRVVRALDLVRSGEPVARGTLRTIFKYTAFDELRRLGLTEETETRVRETFSDGTGMQVVSQVVPGGAAEGELLPGDVLVRVDGELVTTFLPLEKRLDDSVGKVVVVEVERGGEAVSMDLTVEDLHAITPDEFLEVGGGIVHALSYQQARNHVVPVEGLYVATPGFTLGAAGVPDGALLREVDGKPIRTLDDFWEALVQKSHGVRVPVRYASIRFPRRELVAVLEMDRLWFELRRCKRDDSSGLWPCVEAPLPPAAEVLEPATTTFATHRQRAEKSLERSLVVVDFDIPYRTEGSWGSHFRGAGLVVDAEKGLVVVDRDTVPIPLGNLSLTFGGSVRVPGKVEFVHPVHDFSVISYDPELLGDTQIKAVEFRSTNLEPGDTIWQVGITRHHGVVSRRTRVSRVEPLFLPLPSPPQFRETNLEVIDTEEATSSIGGALVDRRGRVVALWASFATKEDGEPTAFFRGIPADHLQRIVEPLRRGEQAVYRSLGVELGTMALADAREMGLSEERASQIEAASDRDRQALVIARITAGTAAESLLEEGDLILAMNTKIVTRFPEVEDASQAPVVHVTVLRDGAEVEVEVATESLYGTGIDQVALWSGVLIHEPHLELASQRGLQKNGVYVAYYWYGSPAARSRLRATRRIIEVDGVAIPDLDTFLRQVGEADRTVRLTTLDLDDQVRVVTLVLDPTYWPTRVFAFENGSWSTVVSSGD